MSVVVAAADIAFNAASGAYLKALVRPEDLLVANGRFESTTWTATVLGPPLGGAAIGLFGPVTTVVADAVSYLLSAAGIRAIGGASRARREPAQPRLRAGDLLDGWRYILATRRCARCSSTRVLVNGLIMATAPLLAVLMLGRLGFAPWQYGLAFARALRRRPDRLPAGPPARRPVRAAPGHARRRHAARVLAARAGLRPARRRRAGARHRRRVRPDHLLRACSTRCSPPTGSSRPPTDRVARTLSAWSVTSKATIAALTALWGLLASLTGPRTAIALAGVLLLATPLLLLREPRAATAPRSPATDPP